MIFILCEGVNELIYEYFDHHKDNKIITRRIENVYYLETLHTPLKLK